MNTTTSEDQPQTTQQTPATPTPSDGKFRAEISGICAMLARLRDFPGQLMLLLKFTNFAAGLPPSTPVCLDPGTLRDVSAALQGCSFEKLKSLAALSAQQDVSRAAKDSHLQRELGLPGSTWEQVEAVFHVYFLGELCRHSRVVELVSRLVPGDGPESLRQQTMVQFRRLLTTVDQAQVESLHAGLSEARGSEDESLRKLESLLTLRPEYFHLYRPFLALLSMSRREMLLARDALLKFTPVHMSHLVVMRTVSDADLFELRSLLVPQQGESSSSAVPSSSVSGMLTPSMGSTSPTTPRTALMTPMVTVVTPRAAGAHQPMRLKIVEQPGERCVYKRNVRPGPALSVVGDYDDSGEGEVVPSGISGGSRNATYHVAVQLFRCDNGSNETRYLLGNSPVEVGPGRVAAFRRLKILVTSHQMDETPFALKFELRRYPRGVRPPTTPNTPNASAAAAAAQAEKDIPYEVLDTVTSDTITVVSHSSQLHVPAAGSTPSPVGTNDTSSPSNDNTTVTPCTMSCPNTATPGSTMGTPLGAGQSMSPVAAVSAVLKVSEVVPCLGSATGGSRVAILGRNFVDSPALRIKFDQAEVIPVFHGPGTLICHTPSHTPGVVSVRVCNAPNCWSDSAVTFTFVSPQMTSGSSADALAPDIKPLEMPRKAGPSLALPMPSCESVCEQVVQGNIDGLVRRVAAGSPSIGECDIRGFAALHYAASAQSGAVSDAAIGILSKAGADLNVRDRSGNTPLHWACAAGNDVAVSRLLAFGADACPLNEAGETPLHCVACTSWRTAAACCSALICNGADPNAVEGSRGETALHRAVAANNPVVVRCLLSHGAHVNVRDEEDDTPLHTAAAAGARSVVRTLMTSGAELNARNADGDTPLQVAVANGDRAMADLLVSVGADSSSLSCSGISASSDNLCPSSPQSPSASSPLSQSLPTLVKTKSPTQVATKKSVTAIQGQKKHKALHQSTTADSGNKATIVS